MIQEMTPPPPTSPSESAEEGKVTPKVYHMPFYHRPGTKEWHISQIENQKGKNNNEKTANWLLAKGKNRLNDSEWNAIHEVLLDLARM
jgi:hypothetical protein